MKTEFDKKLKKTFTVCGDCGCGIELDEEAIKEIKTLVADTVLKAIGEDEDYGNAYSVGEHNAWTRNELRAKQRKLVLKELGIKEK